MARDGARGQAHPNTQAVYAQAHFSEMAWKAMDRYANDLQALETQWGVEVYETPEPILKAQLRAWDKVIASLTNDPFGARVIASQRAWSKRVVGYTLSRSLPPDSALTRRP
jgi:TRAP-type mannitol/chloroaromatic compound transport system substrate-binding protein